MESTDGLESSVSSCAYIPHQMQYGEYTNESPMSLSDSRSRRRDDCLFRYIRRMTPSPSPELLERLNRERHLAATKWHVHRCHFRLPLSRSAEQDLAPAKLNYRAITSAGTRKSCVRHGRRRDGRKVSNVLDSATRGRRNFQNTRSPISCPAAHLGQPSELGQQILELISSGDLVGVIHKRIRYLSLIPSCSCLLAPRVSLGSNSMFWPLLTCGRAMN